MKTTLRTVLIGATAAATLAVPGAATALASSPSAGHATASIAPSRAGGLAAAGPCDATRCATSISFLDFDHFRGFGSETRVRGQVIAKVGGQRGAVPGVRVELFRRINGTSDWKKLDVRKTSTGAFPKFKFVVRTVGSAHYRVVYRGNAKLTPSRAQTAVSTYRLFHPRFKNGTGRFYGRVTPRYGHRKVYLERRKCGTCAYRLYDTDRTTANGSWSFKLNAPRHGKYYWHVYTPASRKFIKSYSAVFTTRLV